MTFKQTTTALAATILATTSAPAATPAQAKPAAEVATFGGGCFWCIEAVFQQLRGIEKIESGYSGGKVPDPTYEQVSAKTTGHAEVVQLTFNPAVVTYRDLLEVFFTAHDPTTLNRQGADAGPQYRSAVFFHSPAQEKTVRAVIAEFDQARVWGKPIVTEVSPFQAFYKAESYHQNYYARNTSRPYCQFVIAPKVAKVRKKFVSKLLK
jgi:peptide-methionine (S)-S-oxide reductase